MPVAAATPVPVAAATPEKTGQAGLIAYTLWSNTSGYIDMQIITDPKELQSICLPWRFSGLTTTLVPTMGYFHAGHESLIQRARADGDKVVVSLFVNPSQFGPNEDLSAYPRDFDRDADAAKRLGADILFAPDPAAMYEPDHATWVEVPEMANTLCGISRPVHFRGVCTVVAKLFMLALPTFAYFGQKDWQQLAILRRMARDLNIPVTLVGCPTVREESGLALSSRNAYLTAEEHAAAPHFQAGLQLAKRLVTEGETDPVKLDAAVRAYWAANMPMGKVDYLSFVHPESIARLDAITGPALVAAAVYMGRARLIDNLLLR